MSNNHASVALAVRDPSAALRRLVRRIDELDTFDFSSFSGYGDANMHSMLDKINTTLAELYGHGTVDYNRHYIGSFNTLSAAVRWKPEEYEAGFRKGMRDASVRLRGIVQILNERIADGRLESGASPRTENRPVGKKVFIVHGHDEEAKQTTARFISQLGLEPVILHERPSAGRTIIEKLELHTQVDFAVVLMTPDDVGASARTPELQASRARQNVVLELGLFIGAIGRDKVCALLRDVELPTDFDGVVYVSMDRSGAWKMELAKEMKHAGLDVDMNKIF